MCGIQVVLLWEDKKVGGKLLTSPHIQSMNILFDVG